MNEITPWRQRNQLNLRWAVGLQAPNLELPSSLALVVVFPASDYFDDIRTSQITTLALGTSMTLKLGCCRC